MVPLSAAWTVDRSPLPHLCLLTAGSTVNVRDRESEKEESLMKVSIVYSFFLGGHCQTVSQPPRRRRKRERKRELDLDQHYERKDPDPISFSNIISY
jgi:hypothetical protein